MANRSREESKEYAIKMAKEHDVKFIKLWFTDILGFLKSFAITVEELANALEDGMGFDGSSIEGYARIDESDMVALPDPDTFCLLPWRPQEHHAEARMFCDILKPGGQPFEGDPRYVLKRNLKRAADLGYTFYVGPELEYFYFQDSNSTVPLDQGSYFDMIPQDAATDMRRETVLTLEEMGIGVEREYQVPEPVEENVYEMTEEERGIGTLPANLLEAIHLTEKSEVVRKALGDHVFQAFIKNKKIEWDQYRTQVTEYELKRYLPILSIVGHIRRT